MFASLSPLLTDLYQLTMAYAYWKQDVHEQEAVFHLFFRKPPFKGSYAIAAGLELAIEWLSAFRFSESELTYLSQLKGNDGKALFEDDFLDYLRDLKLSCDIAAIPEGRLVFAHEPLMRVQGPLLQCQLLETALLNIINFSTLIASKASRIVKAAGGDPVLEFGLRRAQGPDGGVGASRAAYIGGCVGTSNVLAGYQYGIPIKGTHAHSWVMSFDTEEEAFENYAEAMPNNCIFLVDTYDTIEGVYKAIEIGKKLRSKGHEMLGVRLDSGDLAALSIEARKILDEAGFPHASIVASNDLDEYRMRELKAKGAKINVWGIGTRLATAYDQPALGGVYKLAALKNEAGEWDYKVKLSEQKIKVSNPGVLNVRRSRDKDGKLNGDIIWNEMGTQPKGEFTTFAGEAKLWQPYAEEDLLLPIFEKGRLVYEIPLLENVRSLCQAELSQLGEAFQALDEPEVFPVGLEAELQHTKDALIQSLQNAETNE
ncbi:MAG: nicotinate phosphoribosyltransferase [Bacteroidota bacterium]